VKNYLEIGQMPETLNLVLKHKLARKVEPFTFKERKMYSVGQDNKLCRCLTTLEAQVDLKELHKGVARGHFVVDIIAKNIMDASYWWPSLLKDTHEFCKSCDNY
jgi:hypothetical protein